MAGLYDLGLVGPVMLIGSGIATPIMLATGLCAEPGVAGTASSMIGASQILIRAGLSTPLFEIGASLRVTLLA
ncbi:hypothetical protein Q4F19_12625 [Sphingomonas sp. BIUV-7]|uniref:Uncharacterized protein n=1 Tax=Sphingomonas natans TaxID=3063330 RepID=A0ABT8YBY7_9SPHN|nr:hypothetical protein [Sphingomonas sp. BIUV-7]MDO6415229.1 hypothetical protein [Sphingomonas sp. BIUV-7]